MKNSLEMRNILVMILFLFIEYFSPAMIFEEDIIYFEVGLNIPVFVIRIAINRKYTEVMK